MDANATTTPGNGSEATPEKTFTQDEVDAIVNRRIARAMKGVPSDEEITAYRTWKDGQKTEKERVEQIVKERDEGKTALAKAQGELEQLRREKYVLSKGVTGEEAEFLMFRAAKMVDDKTTFEAAVDTLTAQRQQKPTFDWTAPVGGGTKETNVNATMNNLIRQAMK